MLPNGGDVLEQQSRVTAAFKNMVRFLQQDSAVLARLNALLQIDLIVSRLDSIQKLSIYYRSTAPGHPACSSSLFYQSFRVNSTMNDRAENLGDVKLFTDSNTFFTNPFSNTPAAQIAISNISAGLELSTIDQQQKVVRMRWDWDRFEAHNAEWKQVITDLNQTQRGHASSDKPMWYYMDVWNMALQRPDAHTQNLVDPSHENYDCLHCECS
jgi:hypothetical protein